MSFVKKFLVVIVIVGLIDCKQSISLSPELVLAGGPADWHDDAASVVPEPAAESSELARMKDIVFARVLAMREDLKKLAADFFGRYHSRSTERGVMLVQRFAALTDFVSYDDFGRLHSLESAHDVEIFYEECRRLFEANKLQMIELAKSKRVSLSHVLPRVSSSQDDDDASDSGASSSGGARFFTDPIESATDSLIWHVNNEWYLDPDKGLDDHRKYVLEQVEKIMHFLEMIPERSNPKMIAQVNKQISDAILSINPGFWFTKDRATIRKLQVLLTQD